MGQLDSDSNIIEANDINFEVDSAARSIGEDELRIGGMPSQQFNQLQNKSVNARINLQSSEVRRQNDGLEEFKEQEQLEGEISTEEMQLDDQQPPHQLEIGPDQSLNRRANRPFERPQRGRLNLNEMIGKD